ncbi:hypothetical protein Syun_015905 [Stephania yunnanensis]|uniref:RING-type E3 ubiquitin transferase n=1 Tax=Stephania yunnanensis TaxID=152371 RepID=A0AAP0J461_9MAGN
MGQGLSCRAGTSDETNELFIAAQSGNLESFEALLERDPSLLDQSTVYDKLSGLHISAGNGQIEVVSSILNRSVNPDILNRHRQTPLMLAAMHGKIYCAEMLLQAGANILMFDSLHGRTCLHYAAYYGHLDCLQTILAAARSTSVSDSWGFARFVNVRDCDGATPLHLAARQKRSDCVHLLLDSGALVSASTGRYGPNCSSAGSTPLHLAARSGSMDCIRELLAWGADRQQRDASGRIPYNVALKYKHEACAALLNPSSAEPLVWPSPLKFISELNPEAKVLLERALMDANKEREKKILKGTAFSLPSPSYSDTGVDDNISEATDAELCCICFDQVCTIEVQNCGHQMCAHCTLALCCHNKPNPATTNTNTCQPSPVCPFCRSTIVKLVVAMISTDSDMDTDISPSKLLRSRKTRNCNEGSSSFKGISNMASFGKMGGRSSGKIAAESDDWIDKQ